MRVADAEAIEQHVLAVVNRLVSELNGAGSAPARIADTLDTDLGIGSLERVELQMRIESAFAIRLSESAIANTATVQDLVAAVAAAGPVSVEIADRAPQDVAAAVPIESAAASENTDSSPASRLARILLTAWVLVVLTLTLPLLWLYVALVPSGRSAERAVKRWSRLALRVCGIRVRVTGLEHLTGISSAMLVANHASYIDPILLMAAIPLDFHFVAKRGLADYPVLGTVLRKVGHVLIDKGQLASAGEIAAALHANQALLIFAEGTFLRPPGLLPFRLGAFKVAMDNGCPVVPIAIRGARQILPDGTWLFTHGAVAITVAEPLYPRDRSWGEMVRLRDRARAAIAKSCGESATTR